jgi:hypothetical protein
MAFDALDTSPPSSQGPAGASGTKTPDPFGQPDAVIPTERGDEEVEHLLVPAGARLKALWHRHWRAIAAIGLTAAALAPVAVVVIGRWGSHYLPVQDQAVLDLRIRDVFTFSANTPTSGPYGRFGWNHPGPLIFYLQAVFARLTSSAPWSMMVGNALLQGIAIAWTARLAFKELGLRWMTGWLAVSSLSYLATGPWILLQAWNPHVTFPFFCLFLLQAWIVAIGRGRRLLGLVIVGSFLVQTHVGYVVPVIAITAWSVVRLLMAARQDREAILRWQVWIPPAVVLGLLWAVPVVIDPMHSDGSNLLRLVNFYLGGAGVTGPTLGLHEGLGYLAAEFRWPPPWLGGADPLNYFSRVTSPAAFAWLIGPVVLVVVAWTTAAIRRRLAPRILAELLAILLVVSALTLAEIKGLPYAYTFYWRIIVAAATVVLSLFVVANALDSPRRHLTKILSLLAAVAVVTSSIQFASAVSAAPRYLSPMEPIADEVLVQLEQQGLPKGPTLLRYSGDVLGGVFGAVVDALDRQGVDVRVDPSLGFQFGRGRVAKPGPLPVWYVVESSQDFNLLSSQPGARVLAQSHPLSSSDQKELAYLQMKVFNGLSPGAKKADFALLNQPLIALALGKLPWVTDQEMTRLARLNLKIMDHTCLCGVIAFAPNTVPSWAYVPKVGRG